jgi:DNA helicase-2/ATP-dependent DNA helicase PcrA
VVGDDAQSIYGFRGSDIGIILSFDKVYANCREILLNQNYRSTQKILDLAEEVLSHNPHQKKKNLFTNNKATNFVNYYLARNEKDEAEYIIQKLEQLYFEPSKPTIFKLTLQDLKDVFSPENITLKL